jgi:hypothetical protein
LVIENLYEAEKEDFSLLAKDFDTVYEFGIKRGVVLIEERSVEEIQRAKDFYYNEAIPRIESSYELSKNTLNQVIDEQKPNVESVYKALTDTAKPALDIVEEKAKMLKGKIGRFLSDNKPP